MKRLVGLLGTTVIALSLSGCFVHTRDRGHGHGRHASKSRGCHPSQYWDGNKCRHKGKGHGARKHDGKRK